MKNKGAKQKLKRKGAASAFGCDLTEYLESSGQDGSQRESPPRKLRTWAVAAVLLEYKESKTVQGSSQGRKAPRR